MDVLVTGATGFLGANLVELLAADPAIGTIRCFGLPGGETKYVDAYDGVECVYGDITNVADCERVVEGVEVVFHVAGDTSFWNKNYDRQRRINVDGVRNMCEACCKFGVRRLVHTSTADVLGHDPDGGVLDESWQDYSFEGFGYNYGDTKREGEQVALAFNGQPNNTPSGFEVVVIRPGMMLGPYDFTLQMGRVFIDLRDGNVPAIPKGGTSWAHVRSVAAAHIAAAKKGRAGEAYIAAGHNETYQTVFHRIAAKVGGTPPRFTMPMILLVIYGWVVELIANWVTKRPPDMNPGMARYMSCKCWVSSDKAVRDLDYEIPSLDDMLDDCYNWYRENGFL